MGASAGGVPIFQYIFSSLPRSFPAAIFLVLHRASGSADSTDDLPAVLTLRAKLPAEVPLDGQAVRPGRIYVAPRDAHLVLTRGVIRREDSPRESRARSRPSIDVLFRSAAGAYGKRVIGVLLTGALDDGVAGLWQIGKHGGTTIVQDPAGAAFRSMPESAMQNVAVDHCLAVEDIPRMLVDLATRGVQAPNDAPVRVLVVVNERPVAVELQACLAQLGYRVASVPSGEAALASALRNEPDLVLMDLDLGGSMEGPEAVRLLWERHHLPSLFLTANMDGEALNKAMGANPYGFVVKPFRPAQVHAAIQMALERHRREERAERMRS